MSITFANIITNTENRRIGSKFNVKIVLRRLIDVSDLCACALLSDIDSNQIGHIVFLWKLWIVCFAMRHCTEKKKWEKCVFKKWNYLKCVAFKEAWKIVWVFFSSLLKSSSQCGNALLRSSQCKYKYKRVCIQTSVFRRFEAVYVWSVAKVFVDYHVCVRVCSCVHLKCSHCLKWMW